MTALVALLHVLDVGWLIELKSCIHCGAGGRGVARENYCVSRSYARRFYFEKSRDLVGWDRLAGLWGSTAASGKHAPGSGRMLQQ